MHDKDNIAGHVGAKQEIEGATVGTTSMDKKGMSGGVGPDSI